MLPGVVEVQVHLASVGVTEFANLQVNYHQAPEPPMEEYEVDAEPSIVNPETTLATKESEVVTQLQQKIGEVLNQRFFQFRFGFTAVRL